MYSVNPFGNSTLSYNVGSIPLSPELELLEGTGIDWKSLDSHNIENTGCFVRIGALGLRKGPILRNGGPIQRNTVSLNRTGHK